MKRARVSRCAGLGSLKIPRSDRACRKYRRISAAALNERRRRDAAVYGGTTHRGHGDKRHIIPRARRGYKDGRDIFLRCRGDASGAYEREIRAPTSPLYIDRDSRRDA
jgi:hypothetical protein